MHIADLDLDFLALSELEEEEVEDLGEDTTENEELDPEESEDEDLDDESEEM